MTDEFRPWTTNLGEILAELNAANAPGPHIAAIENEMTRAFSCLRHIRRCYNLEAATTTHE